MLLVLVVTLRCAELQVREAITTAAFLQLPKAMPKQRKLERVEEIMAELVRTTDFDRLGIASLSLHRGLTHRAIHVVTRLASLGSDFFGHGDRRVSGQRSMTSSALAWPWQCTGPRDMRQRADRGRDDGHQGHQRRPAAARGDRRQSGQGPRASSSWTSRRRGLTPRWR